MLEHRRFSEMDRADFGWRKAVHHFYKDGTGNQGNRSIGSLYVWNDEEVVPNAGPPAHFHSDVEIISYVREGTVLHRDSSGGNGQVRAGDVQVLSAGSGIEHAELSAPGETAKVFQIWLAPNVKGGAPAWATKKFPKSDRVGRFVVLASGYEVDSGALPIRADARVSGATLVAGDTLIYNLEVGKNAYLVPAYGQILVNDIVVEARDGCAVHGELSIRIEAISDTEIILAEVT